MKKIFNPGLALNGLSGTGAWRLGLQASLIARNCTNFGEPIKKIITKYGLTLTYNLN